ncbi:MAG: flavin reductase family protein [Desulfitobacteriaceae bacterium]|nr:flavin reductase family protein [Desulfitobacteriaceae bacterium]MDD4347212.1 flavin reductase family protein [Desulfitobacteriaceae bacterium]MDD4400945.1 flavin reductase family protein [Desulfitobacteriaceae bacterium]
MIKISKIVQKPTTALFPVPAVLVTSMSEDCALNIATIAWTGIMNSEPPILYIGVNPARYSHKLIKASGEFVINIPSVGQAKQVDYCGLVSGKNVDKIKETGFSTTAASFVKTPLITECPANLECKVLQTLNLGSHDVFIAEILAVHFNEDVLDQKGRPDIDLIKPYCYSLREYRLVADKIGTFGYSKK